MTEREIRLEEFSKRLKAYFSEKGVENKDSQNVIIKILGEPDHQYDNVLDECDVTFQDYHYDKNFESVLDIYMYLFDKTDYLQSSFGSNGGATFYVTTELEGIVIYDK